MELIKQFPYVPSSMIDDKNAFDMDFAILEDQGQAGQRKY